MKCRTCGFKVRCAHCGTSALSQQALHIRRRKKRGVCARCPALLSKRDRLLEHTLCFDCRVRIAAAGRAHYKAHGRADRRGRA